MVLVLDPRFPRVWRTPDTLQFGVDAPRLTLTAVSLAEERMIAALADGVSRSGLRMIAARSRVGAAAMDALLERLAPVLAGSGTPDGASGDGGRGDGGRGDGGRGDGGRGRALVVLDGDGPTAARVLALLGEAGVPVRSGLAWSDPLVESAAYAVIVGSYALEPERHQRWSRRDIPHLPIVFGDRGVVVGPPVRPGRGPCVRCVDLHRTDADPAWPALAAQLHTRPRFGESRLVSDAVSAVGAGVVLAALRADEEAGPQRRDGDTARSQRFDVASGLWSSREHRPHPECGCRTLPISAERARLPTARPDGRALPAPPGSATADGTPDARAGSPDAPS